MSKKIKDEQKKFLGETLNQYDKALKEGMKQLDKKNREQNHKISALTNSFDNDFLEKEEEGTMISLENSKDGMVIINEIQGSTEVNYCKDGEKELILNGDIDTQGKSFVTLTEGVDGGLVDVSLEGNTEVNLSSTKDPVLVTREFDDINCNTGKLQYTIDDVTIINDEPGKVDIDRIVGDTMVNHAVNGSEELILNANINESGDNNITLNGVTSEGGKVDVALEGNTLVNVCDQKDPVAITKSYTVETGNHVALQGEYDGKCRPVVTGNTLVNLFDKSIKWEGTLYKILALTRVTNGTFTFKAEIGDKSSNPRDAVLQIKAKNKNDNTERDLYTTFNNSHGNLNLVFTLTEDEYLYMNNYGIVDDNFYKNYPKPLILEGDYTDKPIPGYFEGLQSSFEDKVVTQEMVDAGEEVAENLGKYKVDYVISKEDGTVGQTKTFYLNSPLLEGDTIEQQGDNVVHVHRSEIRAYETDDELTLPTDMTNTLVAKASPQYEVISQNDTTLCDSYVNGHLDVDSVVPVKKVDFLHFEEELTYLYANTQYTVQFASDKAVTVDITLGGTQLLAQSIVYGINRISITTPSELVNNKLIIDGAGAKIRYIVVTNTDKEFGYFEGMKSVGECEDNRIEILNRNKNLIDIIPSNWEVGSIDGTDGQNVVSTERIRTKSFMLLPKKQGYLNYKQFGNYKLAIRFYDKDYKMIDGTNTPYHGFIMQSKISIPDGAFYYRLICAFINKVDILPNEIVNNQCYLGTEKIPTSYVEPKQNTQQLTHEPLRAVGDVKDKYVLIDGKWYIERNVGVHDLSDITNIVYNSVDSEHPNPSVGFWTVSGARDFFNLVKNPENSIDSSVCNKLPNTEKYYNTVFYHDCYGLIWSEWFRNYIIGFRDKRFPTAEYKQEALEFFRTVKFNYVLKTPTYEEIDYNPFEVYSDITHISVNSLIPTNVVVKNHGYNLVALKENTQYTLYVNKDTTNALTYRLGDYVEINSLSKFTFTTPATLTDKTLRITGKGNSVKDLMLIEGTPANDPVGYFDGLKSSYECERVTDESDENYGKYKVEVVVTGKNKFDKNLAKTEGYCFNDTDGGLTPILGYCVMEEYVRIQPNTTYHGDNMNHIALYDKDKNFIIRHGLWDNTKPKTFTTPSNAYYCRFQFGSNDDLSGVQLEQGDTATEYEPYFESKQTIYLNSPLLKGDEIVWKDNKLQHYHKMKTVIFDGSDDENWINFAINANNKQPNTAFCEIKTDCYTTGGICDSYKIVINDIWGKEEYDSMKAISLLPYGGNPGKIQILIPKSYLTTLDIIGFRNYLNQNPVTIVYPLETPYYEEISVYPLKLNAIANSSLSTESTIQVTQISFNIYEETLAYLYPSTKYYVSFNADISREIVVDLGGTKSRFTTQVGYNKIEITTPADTTNMLTFNGQGINIDHVMVTKQDINEYFEGMKSVGECENNTLEIICKNDDNSKSNTQTLTHEPLRSVGDIKDRYVLIDGKWYIERNCGSVTFDGSDNEGWIVSNQDQYGNDNIHGFFITGDTIYNLKPGSTFICNKLPSLGLIGSNDIKDNTNEYIAGTKCNTLKFCLIGISKSKLSSNDIIGLKAYLQLNPLTIIYELVTPIYEPIDYNPLKVYSDITHITTNSLIPSNMVIKNHGYNCILKPSTTYTIALNKPSGTISAKLGGSAKVDSTNSVFTITTPSTLNDNILRLSGSGNIKDIMILEGDKTVNTPSYFEGIESVFEQEYDAEKGKYRVNAKVVGDGKESTITFYINEPLRGTATSKDKVFIKDNKVIVQRNIKEMLLNGSEDWKYRETRSDGYLYTLDIPDLKKYGVNTYEQGYTDRFYMKDLLPFGAFFEYVNGRDICLQLPLALGGDNANVIKDWLNVNNTRVVYELAEPTYEEADCDLSKLVLENYENSSLIFESNIPVSANIRYSGEVPVVTQAKSLSSQVDNTTLDINENIIPYMCDIDYRIVELQLMNGDTQGEGIELLGIGDIEILGNENVLFNNREDKKYNYSYDMLKRDILSQRYSKEEYQYRLDRYLLANKISDEEYKELEGLLNNGE